MREERCNPGDWEVVEVELGVFKGRHAVVRTAPQKAAEEGFVFVPPKPPEMEAYWSMFGAKSPDADNCANDARLSARISLNAWLRDNHERRTVASGNVLKDVDE